MKSLILASLLLASEASASFIYAQPDYRLLQASVWYDFDEMGYAETIQAPSAGDWIDSLTRYGITVTIQSTLEPSRIIMAATADAAYHTVGEAFIRGVASLGTYFTVDEATAFVFSGDDKNVTEPPLIYEGRSILFQPLTEGPFEITGMLYPGHLYAVSGTALVQSWYGWPLRSDVSYSLVLVPELKPAMLVAIGLMILLGRRAAR